MSGYSRHVILAVRPAVAAAVNAALKDAAWDATGGDGTFSQGLRQAGDASNTIIGYWAAGAATPAMLIGLRNRMLAAGATTAEVSFITLGTVLSAVSSQRIFCFDADIWTTDQVLAFFGADRLQTTP